MCVHLYIYITYTKRYIYNIYMTYRWCLTYVNLPLHPLMNYKHKLCLTIDFNQWNPNVRIRLLIRTLAILHHCINYPPYQGNKKMNYHTFCSHDFLMFCGSLPFPGLHNPFPKDHANLDLVKVGQRAATNAITLMR